MRRVQARTARAMWLRWLRGQPALAGPHAGELLAFAVKLLNRPADAAFVLGSDHVAGLHLVGHKVVRPVGGHQYAEAFQFAVLGHPHHFQGFAPFNFLVRPAQAAHRLVWLLAAGVVDEAVAFQRAVKRFARRQQPLEQGRRGVPAVHQHGLVGDATWGQLPGHIGHVLELGLTVHVGGEEAVVDKPELVNFRFGVHAIDQADADNHAVGVAAVLAAHQRDAPAVALVKHRVVG